MVHSSAQLGASFSCCHFSWQLGLFSWGALRKYVGVPVSRLVDDYLCLKIARVQPYCVVIIMVHAGRLMQTTAGWDTCCPSDVVDVYNSATGTWSTARLSLGRDRIAAISVGNVAVFAGGYIQGASLFLWQGMT
jgi:hypothetical protein